MIAPGLYAAHFNPAAFEGQGVDYGVAETGTPQIGVGVLLYAADGTCVGDKIVFLAFSEKSAKFCCDKLRTLGWVGDDLSNLTGIGSAIGQVRLDHRQNNKGEMVESVDLVTGGQGFKNKMSDAQRRGFAAQYRSVAMSSNHGGGAMPQRPPAGPQGQGFSGQQPQRPPQGYQQPQQGYQAPPQQPQGGYQQPPSAQAFPSAPQQRQQAPQGTQAGGFGLVPPPDPYHDQGARIQPPPGAGDAWEQGQGQPPQQFDSAGQKIPF